MAAWLRRSPGVTRTLFLSLGIAAIALVAPRLGETVNWGVAFMYGITLAVGMRWPIILQGTGVRVVFMTGLVFEALWHFGLATALITLLIEFGVRMLVVYQGRYYWEWHRPIFVLVAFVAAYGLQTVTAGGSFLNADWIHLDTPDLVMVYAFWFGLQAFWGLIRSGPRKLTLAQAILQYAQQTWWAPLLFLVVAVPVEWIHATGYPLDFLICLLLVWLQSVVGPVFTTLNQDRAVTSVIQKMPAPAAEERHVAHRIMRTAHALGRALTLTAREMRLIGYAAVLQECCDEERPHLPLWLVERPAPEVADQIRRRVDAVVQKVGQDGSLEEVAALIRLRYASYDGSGIPAVAGEAFPVAAQVLAAANAVTMLTDGCLGRPMSNAEAVEWLQSSAANRFSPQVLWAAGQVFARNETGSVLDRELPEAVRQLQVLVRDGQHPSAAMVGARRLWHQFWGRLGVAPDLPGEVQAMARLATYFASSTDPERTAQIAAEAVGQLIGAKVAVALRDKGQTELMMRITAVYGFSAFHPVDAAFSLSHGPISRAALDQEPLQLADIREIRSGLIQEIATAENVRSGLFLPIVHRGQTMGLLFVGLQRHHWFTPREVGLIQLMAGQAAAALENATLIREAGERLKAITELNAFTDTLLDNLWTGIIVVDPEGRVVMDNEAARKRIGEHHRLEKGQLLPEGLALAARVERALAGEPAPEVDWELDGSQLEVQSVPLRGSQGEALGAICLVRDVTQVRAMEQQVLRVEKLAAIGELAAGAAHEIRNPLTSIRGFIQLLQARATRSDGEYFQIILNEIDRIDWIIRDMLLLARPSALKKQEVSLQAITDEVLLLHQTDFQRSNISVATDFDGDVSTVCADPKMFRQLVLNLIRNAVQAMPYGGSLGVALRRAGSDQIAFEVTDTGVGISAENLKRLFVPFFTTKEEGTGLGLALCYSIVQAHGGRIDVRSHVGQGTTFTVYLPVR
jgi:signal transduction histidine kinase